jgi:hypothetical protein
MLKKVKEYHRELAVASCRCSSIAWAAPRTEREECSEEEGSEWKEGKVENFSRVASGALIHFAFIAISNFWIRIWNLLNMN